MARAAEPPRAWQRMLSGRRLDLLNPSPLDIEVEDIAHGLARVARWNGQTKGDHAFSVAQHSVLVEALVFDLWPAAAPGDRLGALLHDAPEYVIGDMISPFKTALGVDYKQFEARLEAAIRLRFGLTPHMSEEVKARIKQADQAAADERDQRQHHRPAQRQQQGGREQGRHRRDRVLHQEGERQQEDAVAGAQPGAHKCTDLSNYCGGTWMGIRDQIKYIQVSRCSVLPRATRHPAAAAGDNHAAAGAAAA